MLLSELISDAPCIWLLECNEICVASIVDMVVYDKSDKCSFFTSMSDSKKHAICTIDCIFVLCEHNRHGWDRFEIRPNPTFFAICWIGLAG